jgi:hypothetical protein
MSNSIVTLKADLQITSKVGVVTFFKVLLQQHSPGRTK